MLPAAFRFKLCRCFPQLILFVTVHWIYEIPNSKHQIPDKSQIPNTNTRRKRLRCAWPNLFWFFQFCYLKFWSLVFVCYLRFVIWNFHELNYSVNWYFVSIMTPETWHPKPDCKVLAQKINNLMGENHFNKSVMLLLRLDNETGPKALNPWHRKHDTA